MCFYRDTQAALAQNNLCNLIKQRAHATAGPAKSQDSDDLILMASSEPYKKLHLSRNFPVEFPIVKLVFIPISQNTVSGPRDALNQRDYEIRRNFINR